MKIKLLLWICLSYNLIFAKNYHDQLVLASVDLNNPYWTYAGNTIRESQPGCFAYIAEKWNNNLAQTWKKIEQKIREEINASVEHIDYYLNDDRFIDAYLNHYRQVFSQFIDEIEEQEIPSLVLNFIQNKLDYLQCYKPIKICLYDKMDAFVYSFGTNKEGHYLIINPNLFNPTHISRLYELEKKQQALFYIEPYTSTHQSRIIEYSNLFHLNIALATSNILHQGDYVAKMLQIFTYNREQLSKETQHYGVDYILFRTCLEACLESKNPVECANFIEEYLNIHQEFILLWRDFIEDLENCYHPEDLKNYYQRIQEEKFKALYNNQE